MERTRDPRFPSGASSSAPETGDDEVLPDAPSFAEAPKGSSSSFFSVEPVPLTRYCPHVTKEACREARGTPRCCEDVHFRRIKHPQTAREPNADCHFLQVRVRRDVLGVRGFAEGLFCRRGLFAPARWFLSVILLTVFTASQRQLCRFSTTTCRFQHWELDDALAASGGRPSAPPLRFCAAAAARVPAHLRAIPEPQWICADLSPTGLDLATLGKFGVITIDPPWAIGIDVPYDTLTDSQLRELDVASLQTDGYLLLWVTGRAMELGRRLLTVWGYTRASELVWIKLNLMQNLVRTGRTGHFLNHSKEHCLIGVKGDPPLGAEQHCFRRDCDVLVSELRESSRKPEEIYGVAQRLWPGARCLELFARQHNVGKPGWVAVGNQLDGSVVVDPELKRRLRERYPRVDFE